MGEAEIFLRRGVTFGSARGSGLVMYYDQCALPTEPTDQSRFPKVPFCGDPSHSDRGRGGYVLRTVCSATEATVPDSGGCISTRLHGSLWTSCIFKFSEALFSTIWPTPKCHLCARPCIPAKRAPKAGISVEICRHTKKPAATGELICTN